MGFDHLTQARRHHLQFAFRPCRHTGLLYRWLRDAATLNIRGSDLLRCDVHSA